MAMLVPGARDYTELPYLREVLAPKYAVLPAYQIRAQMANAYGEGAADAYDTYLEFSFGDIGRGLSNAAREVAKAAPAVATVGGGALQGALSGAQFGLPGIIAGAAAGGVGAGLSKYGSGSAREVGQSLSGLTGLVGQFSPLGRIGGAVGPAISGLAGGGQGGAAGTAVNALSGILGAVGGGGGAVSALGGLMGGKGSAPIAGAGLLGGAGGAAGTAGTLASLFGGSGAPGQLLSLLQRPETTQALAALNLGSLGRNTIHVGSAQTPIPTAAISNLIGRLAGEVSAEAAAYSGEAETSLDYMLSQEGELLGDPALDRDRAARVWNLLNEAQAERLLDGVLETFSQAADEAATSEYADAYADGEAQDAAYYDSIDVADAYVLGSESDGESFVEFSPIEWEYASGYD